LQVSGLFPTRGGLAIIQGAGKFFLRSLLANVNEKKLGVGKSKSNFPLDYPFPKEYFLVIKFYLFPINPAT
jgi:hypothetical protein